MRLPDYEIPSNFQPFDDTTHDPDKFANVRDMQVLRKNHNVIVAQRLRRPILQLKLTSGGTPTASDYVTFRSGRPASIGTAPTILQHPVWLTQLTQKLRLVILARKNQYGGTEFAVDPKIYPKLHPLHVQREIDVTECITVSSLAAWTEYAVDFPVPHTFNRPRAYFRGRNVFELCLYLKTAVDDTVDGLLSSGIGISDLGPNWIEPSVAMSAVVGAVIYCDTDYTISPRMLIRYAPGLGVIGRYYVDRPWSRLMQSTDTVAVRMTHGVDIKEISLYELPITDFSPDAAGAG